MTSILPRATRLALAAALALPALAGGAAAQEAASEAAPAPAEAFPVAPKAEPQPGQVYIAAEHDDWQVSCVKAPAGQTDPCQAFQRVTDDQGNPVAEISVLKLPEGGPAAAGVTVLTPLGTLLTANLAFAIDGGAPRLNPFIVCGVEGCLSRFGLPAEDLEKMKKGKAARLTIRAANQPNVPIVLTVSLKGFTAAFEDAAERAARKPEPAKAEGQ